MARIVGEFDWEFDDLEDFVDERIKDDVLPEDEKDAFKNFIKEKVRESKRAQKEAREARKAAVEQMDEEKKAAYKTMRFYKFYPVQTPDTPDISKLKVTLLFVMAMDKTTSFKNSNPKQGQDNRFKIFVHGMFVGPRGVNLVDFLYTKAKLRPIQSPEATFVL
ncbi:hypothetical protein ACLOJK_013143 [Asimina triloba]